MKKFKELRQTINEATYRPDGTFSRDASDTGVGGEVGLYQIQDSRAISQLNSYIGAFNEGDFLNPMAGLAKLRERLRAGAGIDFECDTSMLPEDGYSIDYALSQYGGSFGTTPEHDLMTQGFYEDDGIEGKLGTKLVLRTTFRKDENKMWKVDAMIIPAQTGE
jgi:hypothetical protein